ncbi:MAG TPA: hypothetical protein VN832_01285 [Stellaceae bacterium]|nr:hypothetical protein [Stellaceae bacterium]
MAAPDLSTAAAPGARLINPTNLWWVAAALAVMVGAMLAGSYWFLDFVHVLAGLLWTGIDLFMGFVIGPILRQLDLAARRAMVTRLMPRMIFLMPTLSIITGTTGWYLARELGYFDLPYPQQAWVVAALIVLALLTVQGLGILLPTNLRVCLELQKERPDFPRMQRWMRRYVRTTALQGLMQILIIVIMARFATGI